MYFVDLASTAQARSKLNHYEALDAYDLPVIEVHISNVHADGVIAEFGTQGYLLALRLAAMDGDRDMTKLRLAVAGTGLIGKRHIEMIGNSGECELSAIVDPFPAGCGLCPRAKRSCVQIPRRPLRRSRDPRTC
jgi:hypothetical protein